MVLMSEFIKKTTAACPKGIIYGGPGVGKTTLGASATDSIIVDCENGAGNVLCTKTPYLSNWEDMYNWLQRLNMEEHDRRTIVIDSVDWLLRRIKEHVMGCNGDSQKAVESTLNKCHGGYGQGKDVMSNYVYNRLLPLLDRIVEKGMSVVMLAHSNRVELTDADGITVTKNAPDVGEYLNTLVEWADYVAFARIAGGERQLVTCETNTVLAKNRYDLPEIVKCEWSELRGHIAAGMKKPETKTKPNQPKQEVKK